jgi:hypothetical protein|mmetsp:Transcript_59325/g.92386  ORF Transcript_59325/g.92386 Transcript_59325/m.92386 type:complete len:263 (+) Transcript_59325:75-863(+)
MDTFDGPQLTFEWSPTLVEGSESDGETMLDYTPMGEMEYEYTDDETNESDGCYSSNASTEAEDTECLLYPVKHQEEDNTENLHYPTKRKQRRAQLNCLHCYVAHTGAVAVAASASMIAEDAARGHSSTSRSIAAANTAILACIVGGVVAVLGNLFSGLANVLAPPPQRGEMQEHAGLGRCWLRNSCGLLCFASLIRFIIGFLADPMAPASNARSSQSDVWLFADASTDEQFFRVSCVIALSLISGCFLGLRHPVQSALLCGL